MADHDSKLCPRCQATKPLSEFHRNVARRDGLSVYCGMCMREYCREKRYDEERWASMREAEAARSLAYRTKNREKVRAVNKLLAAKKRAEKPGVVRVYNLARKYREKQATPLWADLSAINAVYLEAKRLESEDGVKRNVDHIIPIQHPLVCGLHVEHNLQILTAFENMSKHNRFEVQ